jgi:2-polyprenyl-3-methyl-5-hydroxy-6-metoxy-1,4-benzoquinol methylase
MVGETLRSLPALVRQKRFVIPPRDVYVGNGDDYAPGHATYTSYNYLAAGPMAKIKAAHFEAALDLAGELIGRTGAIDFGCADGVFLPTLDRHFDPVLGIDDAQYMIDTAQALIDRLDLGARALANTGMSWDELRAAVDRERYGVVFLLETLEHIGTREDMIGTRMAFLRELFGVAAPGAMIVLSVPNMVGIPLAIQRAALWATGSVREPISRGELARAIVLKDVDSLQDRWVRDSHLGFSHRELEQAMRRDLRIVGKRDLIFSKVYAIRER